MNRTERLLAKATKKRRTSQPKGVIPPQFAKGKMPIGLLNAKEVKIVEFLLTRPEYMATLKEMADVFPDAGIYKDTKSTIDPNQVGADEGNPRGYRWAQNCTRKLLRKKVISRMEETGEAMPPGIYRAWPRRAQRFLEDTAAHNAMASKTYTAAALEDVLIQDGNYPTKAARARVVGIGASRWGRLVSGATPKDDEQDKINAECIARSG